MGRGFEKFVTRHTAGHGGGGFRLKRETLDNMCPAREGFFSQTRLPKRQEVKSRRRQRDSRKRAVSFDVKGFKYDPS